MRRTISKHTLKEALDVLNKGGAIAMPTETVYGLAADANNEQAIARIFSIKKRPANHPLIVHISSISQLDDWACAVPTYAHALAKACWPGPLTLILKKQDRVLDSITGGQDSVAIRLPRNEIAQQILQAFGGGLVAPSANSYGRISPTLAQHVQHDLGDKVDLIIDGGSCSIGIESTIVDCTSETPRILRPGQLSAQQIIHITGLQLASNTTDQPRVSGALASHYAPNTPVRLCSHEEIQRIKQDDVVVLSRHKPPSTHWTIHNAMIPTDGQHIKNHGGRHWIIMPETLDAYTHCLYEQLHCADQLDCQKIIIERPPANEPAWDGILDRLLKAQGILN